MEIETRRFVLRDFREEDRRAFQAYQTDPRYLELSGPEVTDPGHALRLFETFRLWASERPRRNHQLAIVEKLSQELFGSCGLRSAGCDNGSAELGIELARQNIGVVTAMRSKLLVPYSHSGSAHWVSTRSTALPQAAMLVSPALRNGSELRRRLRLQGRLG